MGGSIESGRHASPRTVAPLFDRGQAGPAGTVVQVESLQVAGDTNSVGARLLVGVSLGTGDNAGDVAIAPVDGDSGSADGQPYGLVGGGGGPGGDERELVWRLLRVGHPELSRKGGITDPVCSAVSVSEEKDQGRRHYE